ncbi:MAG: fumarate reductase subunit FrdD [Wenzhouxiangella sp.]
MRPSNKPLIWLPFAAGGSLAAFLFPALILVVLLASLGLLPEAGAGLDRMRLLLSGPIGSLAMFFVIGLPLWHAAHRLRMTLQDLGIQSPAARKWNAGLCYTAAAVATAFLVVAL